MMHGQTQIKNYVGLVVGYEIVHTWPLYLFVFLPRPLYSRKGGRQFRNMYSS